MLRTEPSQYHNSDCYGDAAAYSAAGPNWAMGGYFVVSIAGSLLWGARLWVPDMPEVTWALKVYAPGVATPEFIHYETIPANSQGFHIIEFTDLEKVTWTDAMVAAQSCVDNNIPTNQWCLAIVDSATSGTRYRIEANYGVATGGNYATHLGWCRGMTSRWAWVNYAGTDKLDALTGTRVPMDPIIYGWAEEYNAPIPPTPTTSSVAISSVNVVAKDVIKVDFNTSVAVESHLMNAASYQVAGGALVAHVLPLEDRTTTSVFLVLAPKATFGSSYTLTIPSVGVITEYIPGDILPDSTIYTPYGVPIQTMTASWTHHRTKTDAVLASLPGMYNKSIGSNLRSILQAIMISDEEIGGDF